MWLRHSIYIEAPVETVFDFWKDPRRPFALAPDDRVKLVDVKITESGVGTYYGSVMTMLGRTVETGTVYSEVVPNELIVDKSSMDLHGSWRYEFAPEGTGTRLTMQGEPRGLWRLPGVLWLVGLVMGPRHEQVLARLKETLEQADQPVASAGKACAGGAGGAGGSSITRELVRDGPATGSPNYGCCV